LRLLKTSKVRARQAKFKGQIKDIRDDLENMNKFKEEITHKLEKYFTNLDNKTDEINTKFNGIIHEIQLRLQVCHDNLEQVSVKNKQLAVKTDEMDSNMKSILQKNEKLAMKITMQDKTIKEKIETTRNDMLELIGKNQRNLEKQ